MKYTLLLLIGCTIVIKTYCDDNDYLTFPKDFLFGAATSSYQIEGAWNVSSKGPSHWDVWTHECPECIANRSNADVACNSYYKYKEDVALIKKIGFNYYRFSVSWPRVLPNGFSNKVNWGGLEYYKNLTNELIANGIEPVVTIYHFDHPYILEQMGGWTNSLMVDWYTDYAELIFTHLGPFVKNFITINEPQILCKGYISEIYGSPGKSLLNVGYYLCIHNILKAHARAYHLYNEKFRESQGGKIGLTNPCQGIILKDSIDMDAVETNFQFDCGLIAHPVHIGDYPPIVKKRISMVSKSEGYAKSRLPKFSPEWISYIRGTVDFFGLNHYTSQIALPDPDETLGKYNSDSGVITVTDSSWGNSSASWLKVVPEGLGNLLRKIKKEYNNPMVYILENGYADHGQLQDYQRVEYFKGYLEQIILAVKKYDCNVSRYTVWSLLDDFEFNDGYTVLFGIIKVYFDSNNRDRTLKLSAHWWNKVIQTHKLQDIPPSY